MYRQGDVLIVAVGSVPGTLDPIEREGDRIILAHGEVTGHAQRSRPRARWRTRAEDVAPELLPGKVAARAEDHDKEINQRFRLVFMI